MLFITQKKNSGLNSVDRLIQNFEVLSVPIYQGFAKDIILNGVARRYSITVDYFGSHLYPKPFLTKFNFFNSSNFEIVLTHR